MDHLENFLRELRDNGYEPTHELRLNGARWERLIYNGESSGKASGGYRLIQNPDGSLFANYGSTKDKAGFRSWRSEKTRELTYAEIVAAKAARLAHQKYLIEKERKKFVRMAARVARVIERFPVAESHPYLTDKGVGAHGIRIRPKTGELIIPRYGDDDKIWGLQRIIQKNPGMKSWKGYLKGACGKDLFYPLGFDELVNDGSPTIVLVEGFATGASVREATGLPVVVCFDTAGLAGVARLMRRRFPAARVIIGADNDQWTFRAARKPKDVDTSGITGDDPRWAIWRADGALYNQGIEKANAAAAAIGGAHVLAPDFEATHPRKSTDWNDLAREKGGEYVKLLFDKILEIPVVATTRQEEAGGGEFGDRVTPVSDVQAPPSSDNQREPKNALGLAFKVLGYNNGVYYYYPYAMRQIVGLTAPGHSMQNLLQLDKLETWEIPWRDNAGKLIAKHQTIALYAAARLIPLAERQGIFNEESRVRGSGCWIDDGRIVLHCGDALYVDGRHMKFENLNSEFTYVAALRLMKPADEPLGNSEARRLRTICESVTWENKFSGTLLAGWLVIAPVCAALRYRPHIYITGEAESGKSTVMDSIIKPVLGKMGLFVDGGTTEPAIRDMMGYDARPLVYDEAEPSPSMIEVIGLARKATTGAVVKKHGQRAFKARFCACFSAINPPVNKTADESRISFMHLKKNRRSTAMAEYDELLRQIEEVITDDFSQRMIARTLQNMNSLITNIRIFQREVRKSIGGARASQQIGTMLAGVYLLGRTDIITEQAAAEIVGRFTYTDHTIIDQEGDPVRLVQHIAGALIGNRSNGDQAVGELVTKVHIEKDMPADKLLRMYGICVKDGRVDIASRSQNLARLLKDTEWHDKWSRTLSDVPGAEKKRITYFSPGIKTSAISLPIEIFTDRDALLPDAPSQEEIPFDGWGDGRE